MMSIGLRRILLTAILVLCAGRTARQAFVWRTDQSLWENDVRVSPRKPDGYINLGRDYQMSRRFLDAKREYDAAIQLSRGRPHEVNIQAYAKTNIGRIFLSEGQIEKADTAFSEALTIWPDFQPALIGQISVLMKQGASCPTVYVIAQRAGMHVQCG